MNSSKNGMTKLRGKIIIYFALITFIIAVVESAADSTYFSVIYPMIYPSGEEPNISLPNLLYFAFSLVLYVIGGLIFYRVTKKAIKEESARQVKEQNLIYAAIAHDLKTPMTSVQGFAKALSEGKVKPEEMPEICDIICRKSGSMNELIDTLFEYAKFGAEEYEPAFEKVDICVLVRDIIAENYCDLEAHGIEPEIDIPETPVIVNADKKELKRAFTNLALNACKHNPDGISVLVSIKKENGKCVAAIADSGKDIPEDMNIFEPFVTENTSRTAGGGSGLGLAVTKRIIDRMGGSITLSRAFEGYTKAFVVTLDAD